MPLRRVVVTGLGLVTPLGVGVEPTWRRVINGDCGVRRLDGEAFEGMPARVAAQVPRRHAGGASGSQVDGGSAADAFDAADWISRAEMRTQGVDFIAFAMCAAQQAMEDAGLVARGLGAEGRLLGEVDGTRVGVAVGCGIGSIQEVADAARLLSPGGGGLRKMSPFFVPRILINLPAGHISMRYGLRGPNHAVSTACTTGAHAIGDAFRFIKAGDADVMVAGGTEASVEPISVGGFSRARALTTAYNDDPASASRPFDADRSGFVLGEGAGCVVLEELEHALARGATPIAEVRGYGLSGDAHHITAPMEDGSGSRLCMAAALAEAGLQPHHVDYINAHATSTPVGDVVEARGILALLGGGDRGGGGAVGPWVSSTKGALGHLLGAAGAVEAILSILAVRDGIVPPTVNLHKADEEAAALRLAGHGRGVEAPLRVALSNSFGFGGTNASLCITETP